MVLVAVPAGCRREPVATAPAGQELFFPRLRDMVVVKIDPPEDVGSGNAGAEEAARDLFIDRFEVTDGEYQAFLAATGYRPHDPTLFLDHWPAADGAPPAPRERDTPVRWVSLDDALAFARWCGKELPTRDEWLGACPSIASGLLPWSGRVRAGACNYSRSGLDAPTPVGMYQLGMTPSGCYDMIGNVAEWTTTAASGPEKRCVMGGSFADYCDVAEKTGEGRNPGATYARSAEERDTLMAPWLDRLHPDERRNNVGFRCVVRDAAKVVEEALGSVAALPDAKRRQALAELARAGVWPSGENRLLPFVRDYLLSRRRRFALAPDGRRPAAEGRSIDSLRIARCDVARVDSARGAGDDLLLIGDGKLTLLDGRDGSPLFQADLKDGGAHPRHGLLLGRDGTRRVWVEGPNGWLDLVDWRSGAQTSVAELKGGRGAEPTTWCASDPEVRGDAWFVQSGESSTRVVRVAADGVHERMLSGAPPFAPARASDDGLFLPLGHALEVPLPSGWRAGPMKANLGHVSALRLDAGLATTGTTWVADGRVTLPTVPSVRRRYGGNDALRFSWFLAGSGAVCIDAPGDPWLLPTALAATYFVRDGSGNLFVWSGGKGDSLLPQPLPAPAHGDWRVVPAEGNWFEPLVISADGGELRELAQASLAPRARELDWSGDLVFGSVVRAPGRPLIVRTRAGDWFGVALDAPTRRFRRNLGRATIGEQVTQLAGGRAAISAQATPFDVWVRDVEKFDLQDEAGVVRPPIEQFTLADLGGVGRFDPVLLFADGSLVALRPADERLARLGEEWKVAAGGADAGDAH